MKADFAEEMTPPGPPAPFEALIEELEGLLPDERIAQLLAWSDEFTEVPPAVAKRPFPDANHAPRCESGVWVFAVDAPGGTLDFYFAVQSPHGIAARAWAVILGRTCSRQPLEQVARVPEEALFRIFGPDLSMGKGQGLSGMLELVTHAARTRLEARQEAGSSPCW
jgi:sulfur transfer protein SufE